MSRRASHPSPHPALPMIGRVLAVVAFSSLSGASFAQRIDWSWFKKQVVDRIDISGARTLGVHDYSVRGDREAFNSLNNYGFGAKRFTDIGNINITGRKVLGLANFQATIDTNRFSDPNAQRVSIDYDEKPFKINLGDIQGSMLNTNRFASFRKALRGAQVEYNRGPLRIKGLYSEAKGSARTISFTGNNTSGPYYLQASQIVPGSEEVQVDGRTLKILEDYVIRYEYGEITFVNRVISPASTIVVTFESYGFNARKGTIEGAGLSYNFGKLGQLGITGMRQVTGSSGGLSSRRELFQGAGAPSTPYFLELEPLTTQPIIVRLDGVVQTEGIDYRFDPENPTIFFFLRFISLNSTIEVVYTPKPTQTVNGDREVFGFDYRIPIGESGFVKYTQATGKLKNPVEPLEGTAKGFEVGYKFGDYDLRMNWRDIPQDYVSIESRGFNRNEKAIDAGVSYEMKGVRFELSGGSSDIITRTTSGSGTVFRKSSADRIEASFSDTRRVGEPWNVDLSRIESTTQQGKTELNTVGVRTSRTLGQVNARLGIESQTGRGPIGTTTPSIESIALQTLRLDADYLPSREWSINARASTSWIRAGEDNGTGKDYTLSANYTPNSRFSLSTTYAESDAGQLALLQGFQTGFGLGYNGNGFSSGSSGAFQIGTTNLKLMNVRTQYEATDRLSLVAFAERNETTGSYSSNAETDRLEVGIDWNLGMAAQVGLSVGYSNTRYIGSALEAEATTLNGTIVGRPASRWSYFANGSYLLTSGNSSFEQDNFGFDLGTTYNLSAKERVTAAYRNNRTTGYLPQEDISFELSYGYQIWRPVELVGSYKWRDVVNLDGNPSGAYRSKGFDLELRFRF